jgi:nucleotide-binding universal stress UspA family protein
MVGAVVDAAIVDGRARKDVTTLDRILLAVDGSTTAEDVVRVVAALVSGSDAEVFVVHLPADRRLSAPAFESNPLCPQPTDLRAEVSVDTAVRILRSLGMRVTSAVYNPVADVGREIVESARSLACGLIAVGTGGRGRRGSILLGSVARHVIHRADRSVLIVPLSCTVPFAYRRILVAVDGSSYSERAVELAAAVAGLTGAEVVVLHVCDPHGPPWMRYDRNVTQAPETAACLVDRAVGEIRGRGLTAIGEVRPARVRPTTGHLAFDMLEAAAQNDCQMVVAGPRGRAGPDLMLGSAAFQLVHAATVPVLLAR